MKINEVEQLVGISKRNIRFYEKEGLLSPGRNADNGYRDYGEEDVETLRKIKLLRKLDVPLEEIRRMQQGELTLADGLRRHMIQLERAQKNLGTMRSLCQELARTDEQLPNLDAGRWLAEMERMEQEEGTQFVNIRKKDTRKRHVGPVVAAAVILPEDALQRCPQLAILNDSKKLSEKKREALLEPVKATALGFGIGQASWEEIDQLNILQATFLAMRRAVEQMEQQFHLTPDLVLVDGNRDPHLGLQTRTVVKGDGTSACIAAASILAKVTRDRQMVELDRQCPQYGFAKHKGYPTKQHYACIEQYGISPVHRRSFLKKLLQD